MSEAASSPLFSDVSHLIADNRPRLSYGVAAADVDGDGLPELVVTGFGEANLVLDWRDGRLVDIADEVVADPDRRAIGVAAADVDGDGREELYVLNTDTFAFAKRWGDRLFSLGPDGWFDVFSESVNREWPNLIAGRSVAALDRFGRGRYGFVVANYGGPMALFELDEDPGGRLRDRAFDAGLADVVSGGRGLVVAQLLPASAAAGRLDVFAVNEASPNRLLASRGDGTFEDVAAAYGVDDPDQHGRGVVAFDANGDGLLDLAWANWEGPHRLCLQSELGLFGDVAPAAFARPGLARSLVVADLDNDGHDELFLNNIGEPNRLFRVLAGGRLEELDPGPAREPTALGTGAVVADVDGDGVLELLIAHGEAAPEPLGLYKVTAAAGRPWLRVLPRTPFGAPARGALVEVVRAGGRRTVHPVDAGSGYLCQMEPVAHIGLGDDPSGDSSVEHSVESVSIRWPGGATTTIERPPLRRQLVVDHP